MGVKDISCGDAAWLNNVRRTNQSGSLELTCYRLENSRTLANSITLVSVLHDNQALT